MSADYKTETLYEKRIEELKKSHERETSLLKERINFLKEDRFWTKFGAILSHAGLIIFLVMTLLLSNTR